MPGRVRTRRQFDRFKTPTGRGTSGPLKVTFVAHEDTPAVAWAISRQTAKAVTRNRIRRQLRAIFDGMTPPPACGNYLVRVFFEDNQPTYDELQHHLRIALQRAGAL